MTIWNTMRPLLAKARFLHALAPVCALACLAGCGGGGGDAASAAAHQESTRAQAQGLVPQTANDTLLEVYHPYTNNFALPEFDAVISVRDSTGQNLSLNGETQISLHQLPQLLATHPWVGNPSAPGHLRVRFAAGIYRFLPDPAAANGWTWPTQLSGRNNFHRIVLEPMPEAAGEVTISGAWKYKANYQAGQSQVNMNVGVMVDHLWAEGRRAVRARTPNVGAGFYYVQGQTNQWVNPNGDVVSTKANVDRFGAPIPLNKAYLTRQAFQADPASLDLLSDIAGDNRAVIVRMERWQAMRHKVEEVDVDRKRVRVSPALPENWDILPRLGRRYFIENTLAALDAPGEWFWENYQLKYRPLDTSQAGSVSFEIPVVDRLLSMHGSANQPIKFVTFQSLKFHHVREFDRRQTYVDPQSDTPLSAALEISHAEYIDIQSCEIAHTGGYGVWFRNNLSAPRLADSTLYDLGAGGVKIGGSDPAHANDVVVTVSGNTIYSTGVEYPGSNAIWMGLVSDSAIVYNFISDTTYSGISMGGLANGSVLQTKTGGNQIEQNYLYNVSQGVLSDLAGIYLIGPSPGTTVRGNVIKEVRAYESNGHGLYADEYTSNVTFRSNAVVGVDGSGYFQHWGFENQVSNNAFAAVGSGFSITRRLRYPTPSNLANLIYPEHTPPEGHSPATLDGNRFFPTNTAVVGPAVEDASSMISGGNWTSLPPVITDNLVSAQFTPGTTFTDVGAAKLCSGCTQNDNVAITPGQALEAPVVSGMTFDTPLVPPSTTSLPPTIWSAKPRWYAPRANEPTLTYALTPSEWPAGYQPPHGTALLDWKVYDAASWKIQSSAQHPVTFADAPTGERLLVLNDSPHASNHAFAPYLEGTVEYPKAGEATVTFDVKFDANAKLDHEWRERGTGSPLDGRIGPSIRFQSNAAGTMVDVTVESKVIARVPTGVFVNVSVLSPIPDAGSTRTSGAWRLILLCNGSHKTFYNLPAKGSWSAFKHLIFSAAGDVVSDTALRSIWVTWNKDAVPALFPRLDYHAIQTPVQVCTP